MRHSRLPHWQRKEAAAYFLTWRLHGSLPAGRAADTAATGPHWLERPQIARKIIEILKAGEQSGRYELGPWVLMPNHVHLILCPAIHLPKAVAWVKAVTAKEANRLLNRAGNSFWEKDYFDHWIRDDIEERKIARYIERNPVKAGLCATPEEWPWSSIALPKTN